MAQNLAHDLVHVGDWGFCPNRSPKLGLYHGKSVHDIRPLMVVLQKDFPIEIVEMPHTTQQTIKFIMMVSHKSGIYFKENKSSPTYYLNRIEISSIGVGFISRELIDTERLSCAVYHSRNRLLSADT